MDIAFWGMVLGFAGGVVLSFAFAYWLFVLQKKRLRIGYSVRSMIQPQASYPIRMTIPRKLTLTSAQAKRVEPEELESQVEVKKSFRFEVKLKNTGNDVLHPLQIRLALDPSAKIIDLSSDPLPTQEFSISCERDPDRLYVATLAVPYLNPGFGKSEVIVYLVSIDNNSSICGVEALGPGIKTHVIREHIWTLWLAAVTGPLALLLFLLTFVVWPSAPWPIPYVLAGVVGIASAVFQSSVFAFFLLSLLKKG